MRSIPGIVNLSVSACFNGQPATPANPVNCRTLIKIVKERYPDDFQHYWGQFGLDVVDANNKTGWFSYRGKKLTSAADKAMLREHIWAYRFARAGADIEVQAAQILHAVNRIKQFYFVKSSKLDGYALADLITSEYGVALLLDNHVNRPGHVTRLRGRGAGTQPFDNRRDVPRR